MANPTADSAPAIHIIYTAKTWPNISSKINELINIKKVIANSIISIDISIKIIFFLFKTNPKIPIKNKTKDKFIIIYKYTYLYIHIIYVNKPYLRFIFYIFLNILLTELKAFIRAYITLLPFKSTFSYCLEEMLRAFFPNSKTKPKVNKTKKINITIRP